MEIKNSKQFFEAIQKGIVLVEFYADWCGHCQQFKPVIEDLEKTWNKGKIVKINIEQCKELDEQYEIEVIPTLIYFKDGKQVLRTVAEDTKENILKNLKKIA